MNQPYTQILLGFDLVTEGTSQLGEQRELKRVKAEGYRPQILSQQEEKLQSITQALAAHWQRDTIMLSMVTLAEKIQSWYVGVLDIWILCVYLMLLLL